MLYAYHMISYYNLAYKYNVRFQFEGLFYLVKWRSGEDWREWEVERNSGSFDRNNEVAFVASSAGNNRHVHFTSDSILKGLFIDDFNFYNIDFGDLILNSRARKIIL